MKGYEAIFAGIPTDSAHEIADESSGGVVEGPAVEPALWVKQSGLQALQALEVVFGVGRWEEREKEEREEEEEGVLMWGFHGLWEEEDMEMMIQRDEDGLGLKKVFGHGREREREKERGR